MVRICFVCLGNICRSPTAEAVFRRQVEEADLEDTYTIDSAGTGAWHVGEPPDIRSRQLGAARGTPLSGTARRFLPIDFERFDWVIAMDGSNERDLLDMAPSDLARKKVRLFRSFDPEAKPGAEVPDPYFGDDGFGKVFDMCEAASRGLLTATRPRTGSG